MALNKRFKETIKAELARIDTSKVQKRFENQITGFSLQGIDSPRLIIDGKNFLVFNSNDYLGLRFHPKVVEAEHDASKRFGAGPGAVRFISGTMKIHRELEQAIAKFHGRDDSIIFSSAFATNLAVIHSLIKGQSKDSLVSDQTLVISDELNHRSIIDGIRVANLSKENRLVFKHRDMEDLRKILGESKGKFKRVLLISDGVFSMLGVYQDLKKLNEVALEFEKGFEDGIITLIDDCHGIGVLGDCGKGVEEISKSRCDVLIGTFGKGFGTDGGYAVGDKVIIDYLREASATYIYSNAISPGIAGASYQSIKIIESPEGKALIKKLKSNIAYFKDKVNKFGLVLAAESDHAIQPLLVGDSKKARQIVDGLFKEGILVTNISYPIVQKGRDEIRVQLSASHSIQDIDLFFEKINKFFN